ncbi:MAG: hypothetical protein GY906_17160 [bacterium]|nr:hypothetical protein [bacterium]
MSFKTQISVLNERGEILAANVPANFESCWLCDGSGAVPSGCGAGSWITCNICDGDGYVLAVDWKWVDQGVRDDYERIWNRSARA